MKGVLKIKLLKKYIPVVLTAFLFLFININNAKAETLDNYDLVLTLSNIDSTMNKYYSVNRSITYNTVEVITDRKLLENEVLGFTYFIEDDPNKPYNVSRFRPIDFTHEKNGKYYYRIFLNIDIEALAFSIPMNNSTKFDKFNTRLNSDLNIYELRFYKKSDIININNLNYDINNNEITFNYDLPTDDNFSHLELHQDGLLLADNITTNIFEVYNLEYDTKYNFTFYSVSNDGSKSSGISREIALPSDPNLIPSNNIFGLNHSVSDTNVSFNYSLPLDNNFSHLKIYRNNELINDNYQLSEFIDTGLEPETEYNYRFVSVNKMDISNVGYSITIKTMEENDDVPPDVPTGLETTNMNSGIVLSWNSNNESDLRGYYVYMNGKKMNNKPITNSFYNITNLENGIEYNFTVSAVDTFDNESEQSLSVLGVPDVDNLPIFKLDTQLSSIGSSVENWFSEIWLIVAFATAIPLSFAIANRVKGLFIA